MKSPKRRQIPVFTKLSGEMQLIGSVSASSTSIGAAKAANTDTARFGFVDNKPAWIAFDRVA